MTKIKDTISYHYTHSRKNLLGLGIRIIQSVIAAVSGVIIVHSFNLLIQRLQHYQQNIFFFLPAWTVIGAMFVILVIYKISPGAKIEGGFCYIQTVNSNDKNFNLKDTIFKYWAALFTLGTFGNGGIVAPVGRVSAGINCVIEDKLHSIQKFDLKVGAISGFAAAIGTIFHTPIAGGFFAVEILEKSNMKYRYLFPALLSSGLAVYFARLFNLPAFYRFQIPAREVPSDIYLWVILIGIVTGAVGRFYNVLYRFISHSMQRNKGKNMLPKAVTGSLIVALVAYFINPDLMGTSNNLIYQLTNDVESVTGNLPMNMNLIFVLLVLLIVKMVGNCVTVGTGLSAGFTGPIIIVGMLIGVIFSTIAGIEYYTSEFYALICAGFTGMLASSMNIPIAAMILSVELFGYNYVIIGILTTIIAFKINDYNTLFEY